MTNPKKTKVQIELPNDHWSGIATESIWVKSTEENYYMVQNTPFFAKGLSYNDVIDTFERSSVEWLKSIVQRGGHSTYRIFQNPQISKMQFEEFWRPLFESGCTYESMGGKLMLYAVDVSRNADIHHVYKLLENGERNGIWEFEEGHCGHKL